MTPPSESPHHAEIRYGISQLDVTPPVGIFHRFWGAANHDVATDVHRPIFVTASALAGPQPDSHTWILVTSDHCILRPQDMAWLRKHVEESLEETPGVRVSFSFGHSHSAGHICSHRGDQPGGELIAPYLDLLLENTIKTVRRALAEMEPARVTFANTTCTMGAHRDFKDPADGRFVCGFNPSQKMSLPVQVLRVRTTDGRELGSLVTYPCHPTTLAWENSLISPDYIGAMREVIQLSSGVPCQFLLAPCGDIGPRHGFVGDPGIADSNGRQLGHSALSAWHSLDHTDGDFVYQGPVLSGATLGEWRYEGWSGEETPFFHERFQVDLPYRKDLRTPAVVNDELAQWEAQGEAADSSKPDRAGTARAMAERCRREWERVEPLPVGDTYPLQVDHLRLGTIDVILVEGEPYFQLLTDLQAAVPDREIVVGVLSEGSRCSYMPTLESYSKQLYQVDVSLLAAGCLETLTEAIAARLLEGA